MTILARSRFVARMRRKPFGHYSEFRSFDEARSAIQSDFTKALRSELPKLFFDPPPVVVDDSMAAGTKYDLMMKISENVEGYAVGILLNDPDASFLEYIGGRHGDDWQEILGTLEVTAASIGDEIKLL